MQETFYQGRLLLVGCPDAGTYFPLGVYQVVQTFNWPEVLLEYEKAVPSQARSDRFEERRFLEWMVKTDYLKELDHDEFWVDRSERPRKV